MWSIAAAPSTTASTSFNTLDGQVIAIDVKTGKPLWRTQLGNINVGETMTMAPTGRRRPRVRRQFRRRMGVRGWVTALDENTGKLWRAYNTGPDADVLIGADFKPFYAGDQGKDLGVKTWPAAGLADRRRRRVGLDHLRCRNSMLYHGTGNPGSLECRAAARAITNGRPAFSRAIRKRLGPLVLSVLAAR
jgi:hypothetical protein